MVDSLKPQPGEERVEAAEEDDEDKKESFLDSWLKLNSKEIEPEEKDNEQKWWQKLTDRLFKNSVDLSPVEPVYAIETTEDSLDFAPIGTQTEHLEYSLPAPHTEETAEMMEQPGENNEVELDIQHNETDNAPASQALQSPEKIGSIVKRVERDSAAISALEIAHKKREAKNKRHIKKLKKEAKTAKKEREEIRKQQKEFEKHLDQRIEEAQHQDSVNYSEAVPAIPVETAELPEKPAPIASSEKTKPRKEENLKEIVKKPRPEKPEEILDIVEKAAEQNAPIEKLYEQRHEMKDSSPSYLLNRQRTSEDSSARKLQAKHSAVLQQHIKQVEARNKKLAKSSAEDQKDTSASLYHQAIMNGFWTAIIVISLMAAILLIA